MDLWFLIIVAAAAGGGCLVVGVRQRRVRWLTLGVGLALLLIAAIALLQRSPG